MHSSPRSFWSPLLAGAALGAVLLATFLFTGHGLGASGFFARATAWLGSVVAEPTTKANSYLGLFLRGGNPLASWITWEIIGVALGALIASTSSGRFRFRIDGAPRLGRGTRLGMAFAGGALTGFGARLARGCTSGLGLSGSAPLAVAGFVFLIGFFVAGVLISALIRGAWK